MRKSTFNIFILSAVLVAASSCTKWLDVQPKDELVDTKLFGNVDGYRNAVNGLYQDASSPALYGRNLTWGTASALAQDYNSSGLPSPEYYLAIFNFTHVNAKNTTSAIWATAYNVIANCNKIIRETEGMDTSFFPLLTAEKNLILGESIAMRAMLHFDLLRLFATPPSVDKAGKFIPYQRTYPGYLMEPMANSAIIDSIVNDLELAQKLVARNDTIINRTVMGSGLQSLFTGGNTTNGGLFFNFRMHRLNYVAIQGLLARVHMYNGNYAKALEKSEYLYKNFGPTARLKWWTWTQVANVSGTFKYHKMPEDVLFGLYNPNLVQQLKSAKYSAAVFALAPESKTIWFPAEVRDNRQYLFNENGLITAKWNENLGTNQYIPQQNTLIPVLRLSEIFYIYSECLFRSGNKTDALKILNEVRLGRGRTTVFTDDSDKGYFDELFMEYRREFVEDGQTMFNHKRIQRPIEIGARKLEIDNRFVLPIPDGERIF